MAPRKLTRQFVPVEEAEYLEAYTPGGFHPVHLGDRLGDGRYEILHKLGWGGYSTTWLARDLREHRYVAIKIAVAKRRDTTSERVIRSQLTRAAGGHPGGKYIQHLIDTFTERGPNGVHECFVSIPGGCNVTLSKIVAEPLWMFPVEVARAIAAQMIFGVAFLHSQGIAHGGTYSLVDV